MAVEPEDPWAKRLADAEAKLFNSNSEREAIRSARTAYPRQQHTTALSLPALPFEDQEDSMKRRIMGFGLGFEKIFATTSYNLPISAHTIFAELRSPQSQVTFKRLFNGHNSVFDIKKWIFEKLLVPMDCYALSYAEAGKANLHDQLPLLTTHDSLDTRTLATTRAVHNMYRGTPGVHSLNDVGVTQVYARLKCRKCGDLLNGSQSHPKMNFSQTCGDDVLHTNKLALTTGSTRSVPKAGKPKIKGVKGPDVPAPSVEVPADDPSLSDAEKYIDCVKVYRHGKFCYFHTRGYELFEAARTHGFAELARIDLSCDKWPSRKQQPGQNVLVSHISLEPRY